MDSFTLVIFGITSNLAQIKLIPALYDMAEKGLLPKNISIIGSSRTPMDKKELKNYVHKALISHSSQHNHGIKNNVLDMLLLKMLHIDGYLDDPKFYLRLKEKQQELAKVGRKQNVIYYLATYPELYHFVFENLNKNGMNLQNQGWVRLMIEKPIGKDLESAKKLDALLLKHFVENQIFRLDHYLGKETVQNILTFRFGNGIFEPLMNKDYIDHIQISSMESFGIGSRGGYYDSMGALKDVGQNHLLQMLAFATMDAPTKFTNEAVTKKRLKILKKLIPMPDKLVLGQYDGYRKEQSVDPKSQTDSFFAFKTGVGNGRFSGVPIYIRGGKMVKISFTEISIVFKTPKNRLFSHLKEGCIPNVLTYKIQPNEGIGLKILYKKPGHELKLNSSSMEFSYPKDKGILFPDPYERLVIDAIRGDQTFFNDSNEVETQWLFIDRLSAKKPKPQVYPAGSMGPKDADRLINIDQRAWIDPEDS